MLPIIDVTSPSAARAIDRACRQFGFFAISNHGVSDELRTAVVSAAIDFFGRSEDEKERVALSRGGPAWRGWFPLGGELTSGVPDLKEGYYFGRELPVDDRPMHGPNIWPSEPAALRPLITEWMATMEPLAQRVLALMAEGLGLDPDFFCNDLTADPTPLFRIFRYPPHPSGAADRWGVAEHSDYGLRRSSRTMAPAACRSRSVTSGSTLPAIHDSSFATSATCSTASPPAGTGRHRTERAMTRQPTATRYRSSSTPAGMR
jgi:isopenicillin N synthase-like dioxygenase